MPAKKLKGLAYLALVLGCFQCVNRGPEPIHWNHDDCANCKMSISDKRFGCELLTLKGRIYKFDDLSCLLAYVREHPDHSRGATYYVYDYCVSEMPMSAEKLHFVSGESVASPMGGNIAAFSNKDSATHYSVLWNTSIKPWELVMSTND